MFGSRTDRTADELRRVCREVDAMGDELLGRQVVAANAATGRARVVPRDYVLGFMVAFFVMRKLMEDGPEGFTGEDAARFAMAAWAETED